MIRTQKLIADAQNSDNYLSRFPILEIGGYMENGTSRFFAHVFDSINRVFSTPMKVSNFKISKLQNDFL